MTENWTRFNESTRYRMVDDHEEAGYLELPPLYVHGGAKLGQAILWVKQSLDDESPKWFTYVYPEELEPCP